MERNRAAFVCVSGDAMRDVRARDGEMWSQLVLAVLYNTVDCWHVQVSNRNWAE